MVAAPAGVKDIRTWLTMRVNEGLDLNDAVACKAAAEKLLAELRAGAEEAEPQSKPKQSELLVRVALERYRIGLAEGDEPFAVPHDGPNVALMFRGARDALRSTLSREYRRRYGSVPNASALADALTALYGEALECPPEPLYLRLARRDDAIVLDLGRADGSVVVINSRGWAIADVSPVLFKRTALTGALPVPERAGDLELLRSLINITPESWPLVQGELVESLISEISHPIMLLSGEQGTGKTTAGVFIVGLHDPSPAEVRSPPRDPEQWAISAAGSRGIVVDNVSSIPDWFSDALCKASTGDDANVGQLVPT